MDSTLISLNQFCLVNKWSCLSSTQSEASIQRCQGSDSLYQTCLQTRFGSQLFQYATSLLVCNETPNHAKAECIDQEITWGCLHSEHQCQKYRLGSRHLELHDHKVNMLVLCQYTSHLQRHLLVYCLLQQTKEVDLTIPSFDHLSEEIKARSNAITSIHTDSRKSKSNFLLHCANVSEELQQEAESLYY